LNSARFKRASEKNGRKYDGIPSDILARAIFNFIDFPPNEYLISVQSLMKEVKGINNER
jgi:hypothetical protein